LGIKELLIRDVSKLILILCPRKNNVPNNRETIAKNKNKICNNKNLSLLLIALLYKKNMFVLQSITKLC
jgi:hypothetical protein